MKKVKSVRMKIVVEVEVACVEPESFVSNEEFKRNDATAMKSYVRNKISNALLNCWQNAARVDSVSVSPAMFVK